MQNKRLLKLLSVCLAVLMLMAILPDARVSATDDPVDVLGRAILQGIRNGESTIEITLQGSMDMNDVLNLLFTRYPVLFHYYDSSGWYTYDTHVDLTYRLKNLSDPIGDIPVIRNEDELMAVLGLGLSRLADDVKFVCADGFAPDTEMIHDQFERLRHEHGLIYMGHQGYAYTTYSFDCGTTDYNLTYQRFYGLPAQTVREWRDQTEQVALYLCGTLFSRDMPDYERVLRIHDWIINNTRYNIENMDEAGNHLSYGALVKGSCVCQGYAEAFLLLAKAAGLEVYYVPGYGTNSLGQTESHGWNAVLVQGQWYMIDTTWDDPVTYDDTNVLRYDYFLLSGQELAADHTWEVNDYPICNGDSLTANWVLEQSRMNQNIAWQYDASVLQTQAESVEELSRMLTPAQLPPDPVTEPTTPEVTVPPTIVVEVTEATQPAQPTNPGTETQPAQPDNPIDVTLPARPTAPDRETQPVTPVNPVNPVPQEEKDRSWVWVALAGLALVALVALIRGLQNAFRRPRKPTYSRPDKPSPFSGGGGAGKRSRPSVNGRSGFRNPTPTNSRSGKPSPFSKGPDSGKQNDTRRKMKW